LSYSIERAFQKKRKGNVMTDEKIIELYRKRDEQAIRESYTKYGRYCFAIANNILHDREDSEECVNDTWLKAWHSIPPKHPARLRLFFAKITRNLSINRYKAKTADKRGSGEVSLILDELSECLSDPDSIESEYMAKELAGAVNRFVHTLPERECNIFIRRYFYTEPITVIADRYGLTGHHITVMLSRTRGKLKQHLIKEDLI